MEDGRYLCLDVLRVSRAGESKPLCDSAILLEVWGRGGLLQVSTLIPEGSILEVAAQDGPIRATVSSCTADDYGCLVEFEVDSSANWFPKGYNPPYLRPSDTA